ncbi:hypothetical protein GCM10029963_01930 [Micromonospora andamanensis]
MWQIVFAAKTTLAGPSCAAISAPTASSKKAERTRTPAARATSATPPHGSTPRCRTPAARTAASMVPSLEPISTMNGSLPVDSRSRRSWAVRVKCSRIRTDPEETYGYESWNIRSRGTSANCCTIEHDSQTPTRRW